MNMEFQGREKNRKIKDGQVRYYTHLISVSSTSASLHSKIVSKKQNRQTNKQNPTKLRENASAPPRNAWPSEICAGSQYQGKASIRQDGNLDVLSYIHTLLD